MSTAVVHLMRRSEGLEPFEAFMSSYERHDAGLEHELVLLLKGYESRDQLAPVRRRLRGHTTRELPYPDPGPDIEAYLDTARMLPHDRLCFVNAFTTITTPDWLGMLSAALDDPRAGAVGATASWASHRSFALSLLRLPNGYRGALGERRVHGPALRSVGREPHLGRLPRLAKAAHDLPEEIVPYGGFPAPHVRTNGFLVERRVLLSLPFRRVHTKAHAHRFEAGRHGLSGQLLRRGLTLFMVGCDGEALPHPRWADANIFWQGDQRNLLLADNQTRHYTHGTPAQREALARFAWGAHARTA